MNAETMRDPVEVRLQEIEQRWHGDAVATRADIAWLIEQVRSQLPQVDYRFFDKFGNPVEEEPSDPPTEPVLTIGLGTALPTEAQDVKPCSECGGWGVLTRHDEWWTCPLCRGSGKDEP